MAEGWRLADSRIQHQCAILRLSPEQLAQKSDVELLRIPNFGRKSLARLRELYGPPAASRPLLFPKSANELLDDLELRAMVWVV